MLQIKKENPVCYNTFGSNRNGKQFHYHEVFLHMNLNNLYYYKVIVEEGSLSQAAKVLYISQPSLSHFLTNLEKELGISLFYRKKNHPLTMTPAGELYYKAAKDILTTWAGLENDLQEFRNKHDNYLSIGLSTSRCPTLLSLILPAFREQHPGVKIHMESRPVSKLQAGVSEHEFDIAFSAYLNQMDNLRYEAIHTEEVDLVVPLKHPMYQKFCSLYQEHGHIKLPWVEDAAFVLVDEGHIIHDVCFQYFQKIGFTPNCNIYVEASVTCADIIASSGYLGLIPRHSVALSRDQVVTFPLDPPMIHTTGFYYNRNHPSSLARDMVRLLKLQLDAWHTENSESIQDLL